MRKEALVALLAVGLTGCASRGGDAGAGTGGRISSGGVTGRGGDDAAGRASGLGGQAGVTGGAGDAGNAGGSPNSGMSGGSGSPETGGAVGAGASSGGTGGASGAGGTSGAVGASGSGGMAGTGSELGGAGGSAPACPAGRAAPTAGDSTVTLQAGGRSRKYILHVPSGLTAGSALALVFDLHGAGGNGSQQKGLSGFSALSDKEKFLVVFPDGVDGYWNVDDKCCGTAGQEKIDDVGFLRAILGKLSAELCIDPARVYVTGFSNGGGLAHRMGCDAADVIAAIAPTATDLRTQPCNAARPISMMEVKGMADSLEPYAGGLVGMGSGQYTAVGAKASLELWAEINHCTGTPTERDEYCESYTECADGVETDLCSLPNVEHDPYNSSLGFNVAGVAWSMFERHPLSPVLPRRN